VKNPLYKTKLGKAYCDDCIKVLKRIKPDSIDLVITSPPFALQRKKSYGNVPPDEYVEWFLPYTKEIFRILKPTGSFVLDIGGSWNKGEPTRTLYHFELLLRLSGNNGPFKLAQEFYWYNPAKMPAPAQWVTIERLRVKDAVNPIWWLAKSSRPKADNRRVLKPYKKSMEKLFEKGYNDGLRPSGHMVSNKWSKHNGGAIPPNLIKAANTKSYDKYLNACRKYGIKPNPSRFVDAIPEFFIRFLTEPGDVVLDPFAGSNVVGEIAERLERKWVSIEMNIEYAVASAFRFDEVGEKTYSEYISACKRQQHANTIF
jgi:site-specific DNA-methyltransferase (cytosine-N4-specific)